MFYWHLKIHGIREGGRAGAGGKTEWQRANKDMFGVYSNLSAGGYRCFYGAQGNILDKCKVHNRPSDTGWVNESESEREREGEFELAKAVKWGSANGDGELCWEEVGQTSGVCVGAKPWSLGLYDWTRTPFPHVSIHLSPSSSKLRELHFSVRETLNIIKANGNMTISLFNLTVPRSPALSHLTK